MPPPGSTQSRDVAQSLPNSLVNWLVDRGLIRSESVIGTTSRTALGLDHAAVSSLMQGGPLLQLLLHEARPFRNSTVGRELSDTKPQMSLTPAAKIHNFTAIFRLWNEDSRAGGSGPVFSEEDLELWLCGDWESIARLLSHTKRELPRAVGLWQQQHEQHQQQSAVAKRSRVGNAADVVNSARKFADAARDNRRGGSVGAAGQIGGGSSGIRLHPLNANGRRLPHSSDSINSNPFLDNDAGGPRGSMRNAHQRTSEVASQQQILQAAQLLLQQQQLHQQLSQQQQYLHWQQQQQYYAAMALQQQQQHVMSMALQPNAAPTAFGSANIPFQSPMVQPGFPFFALPPTSLVPQPAQQLQRSSPPTAYEGILQSHLQGHTPNTYGEFGTPPPRAPSSVGSSVTSLPFVPRQFADDASISTGRDAPQPTESPPRQVAQVPPPAVAAETPLRSSEVRGSTAARASAALLANPILAQAWRNAVNDVLRYQMALRRQSFALWRLWQMRTSFRKREEREKRELRRREKEASEAARTAALKEQMLLAETQRRARAEELEALRLRRQEDDIVQQAPAGTSERQVLVAAESPAYSRAAASSTPIAEDTGRPNSAETPTTEGETGATAPTRRDGRPVARKNAIAALDLERRTRASLAVRYIKLWIGFVVDPPESHVQKKLLQAKYTAAERQRKRFLPLVLRLKSSNALRQRYFNVWRFVAGEIVRRRLATLQHPEPLWMIRRNEFLEGRNRSNRLRELRRKRLETALLSELRELERQQPPADHQPQRNTKGMLVTPQTGSDSVESMLAALERLKQEDAAEAKRVASVLLPQPRKCTFCGHLNDGITPPTMAAHPQQGDPAVSVASFQQHTWCVMCGEVLQDGDEALYNFILATKHNVLDPLTKRALLVIQAFFRWRHSNLIARPLRYRAAVLHFQDSATPMRRFVVTVLRVIFAVRLLRKVLGRAPRLRAPVPFDDPAAQYLPVPVGCRDRCEHLLMFLHRAVMSCGGNLNPAAVSRYVAWMCEKCGHLGVELVTRRANRKRLLLGGALRAVHFVVCLRPKVLLSRDVLSSGIAAPRGVHWYQRFGVALPVGYGVASRLAASHQHVLSCKRCVPILIAFAEQWSHHTLLETTSQLDRGNEMEIRATKVRFSDGDNKVSIFEPRVPSIPLQRRWNALLCSGCRDERLALVTVVGLCHDYCTKVHALRMYCAFRLCFRVRARASIANFAVERLGYVPEEVRSIVDEVPRGQRVIAAVMARLKPQGSGAACWCYVCDCFVTSIEAQISSRRSASSRHHVTRERIVAICDTHMHRHAQSTSGSSVSCAALAKHYLLGKLVRKYRVVFCTVSIFIAQTFGRRRARAAAAARKRRELLSGQTPRISGLCRRCQAFEPHLVAILQHADTAVGEMAVLPYDVALDSLFGESFRPPMLCDHAEPGLTCHRAAFEFVVEFVDSRNKRVVAAMRADRRAAAAACPRRPEKCAEGLFDSCKERFKAAAEAIRDAALERRRTPVEAPPAALSLEGEAAAMRATCQRESKKLCSVCVDVLRGYAQSLAEWVVKDAKLEAVGSTARPQYQ